MKNLLITLAAIAAFTSSFAQSDFRDGFIITSESDTLKGQLDYRSYLKSNQSCLFRGSDGETAYQPHQIRGYGFINDKYYSSGIIDDQFVEALVIGKLSLYKSKNIYWLEKEDELNKLESRIVQKHIDGNAYEKLDTRWKGLTAYMISDCISNPNNAVSNIKFEDKSLSKIVIKYNECSATDYQSFVDDNAGAKIKAGILIGINYSTVKFDTKIFDFLEDSYNSFDPTFGLVLETKSSGNERISFQLELLYARLSYSGFKTIIDPVFTETYESSFELTTLSLPISMKYSLPGNKFKVTFQGGIRLDSNFKTKSKVYAERYSNDVLLTTATIEPFEMTNIQFGFTGGMGISRSYSGFKTEILLRYTQMFGFTDTIDLNADNNGLSLNMIFIKN